MFTRYVRCNDRFRVVVQEVALIPTATSSVAAQGFNRNIFWTEYKPI